MSRPTTKLNCGCEFGPNEEGHFLLYCHKHGAAPEMLEALIELTAAADQGDVVRTDRLRLAARDAEAAIAKAEAAQ